MIKHECEDLFQHFSRLPAFFISYKTSFFLDYCPNFVSFSKLLANYFLNEDGSNINQFPFLMLTNIDNVDRAPQNCCMSSVLNFLGLPNFLILILPEKVRKDVGFGFLRSYFFRLCLLSFSHHGSSPTTPSSFIKSTSNKNLSLFRAGPLFFFVDEIHKSFLSSHYKSFHSCQTFSKWLFWMMTWT